MYVLRIVFPEKTTKQDAEYMASQICAPLSFANATVSRGSVGFTWDLLEES